MTPPRPPRGQFRERFDAIVATLPDLVEQLDQCLAEFARGFNAASLAAATHSSDPLERNRVATLERLFGRLVNDCHRVANLALKQAKLDGGQASAASSFAALAELGAISAAQAERLESCWTARNIQQHDYEQLQPEGMVEAVLTLRNDLSPYLDALTAWLDAD